MILPDFCPNGLPLASTALSFPSDPALTDNSRIGLRVPRSLRLVRPKSGSSMESVTSDLARVRGRAESLSLPLTPFKPGGTRDLITASVTSLIEVDARLALGGVVDGGVVVGRREEEDEDEEEAVGKWREGREGRCQKLLEWWRPAEGGEKGSGSTAGQTDEWEDRWEDERRGDVACDGLSVSSPVAEVDDEGGAVERRVMPRDDMLSFFDILFATVTPAVPPACPPPTLPRPG